MAIRSSSAACFLLALVVLAKVEATVPVLPEEVGATAVAAEGKECYTVNSLSGCIGLFCSLKCAWKYGRGGWGQCEKAFVQGQGCVCFHKCAPGLMEGGHQ